MIYSVGEVQKELKRTRDGFLAPSELLAARRLHESAISFRGLHAEDPASQAVSEDRLNSLGYECLNAGKNGQAITVFQLNTEFYPASANAFDSLGEAFMLAGDRDSAIFNYKRSLELDPGNTNARSILRSLQQSF